MVFQWFWQSWTITIECFLGGPTIGTNGFSMVFKILRAMVNNGFEITNDCLTCADGIGVAGRYLPDCLTAHCTLLKESLILKWTLFNLFSGLKMSWTPWQMGLKLGLSASVLAPPNIDNWKTMDVKCNVININTLFLYLEFHQADLNHQDTKVEWTWTQNDRIK